MNIPLKEIGTLLRSTKGILDVKWLDQEAKKRALALEEGVHKEVLSGRTGAYYNQGAMDVLSRKYVCVVLNNNEFRHATEPSLFWVAGDIVIGEEVMDPGRLQALIKQDNIKILKKNFVLYFDRMKETRGQIPVFVIRGLPFHEIEGIREIHDVLSASPIGSVDVYFKKWYGWDIKARDLGTILIGFNLY